jgi:hypothetical protein
VARAVVYAVARAGARYPRGHAHPAVIFKRPSPGDERGVIRWRRRPWLCRPAPARRAFHFESLRAARRELSAGVVVRAYVRGYLFNASYQPPNLSMLCSKPPKRLPALSRASLVVGEGRCHFRGGGRTSQTNQNRLTNVRGGGARSLAARRRAHSRALSSRRFRDRPLGGGMTILGLGRRLHLRVPSKGRLRERPHGGEMKARRPREKLRPTIFPMHQRWRGRRLRPQMNRGCAVGRLRRDQVSPGFLLSTVDQDRWARQLVVCSVRARRVR